MNNIIKYRNAEMRYWVDEFPDILIYDVFTKSYNIETQCEKRFKECRVAVELYLHKNANNYGLLGIKYQPNTNVKNAVKVIINYVDKNKFKFEDNKINKSSEYIYMGLPEEFEEIIFDSVSKYININNNIPAGEIDFTIATNCEVGSSQEFYANLVELLLEALVNLQKEVNMEKEDMDLFFTNIFNNSQWFA